MREILARGDSALFRSERSQLEAETEILVLSALNEDSSRVWLRADLLLSRSEHLPSPGLESRVFEMALARASGRLLQHVTGVQPFGRNIYEVSPAVLIPRQETEVLLQECIEALSQAHPSQGVEVGLGSGILSVELLAWFPHLNMIATEHSVSATEVARRNAVRILKDQTRRLTIQSVASATEVLDPLLPTGLRADFLISNPPYLSRQGVAQEFSEVDLEVIQNEPEMALFGPEQEPNYFYRKLAEQARSILTQGGRIFLEVPHERAHEIQNLFINSGWKNCRLVMDLTGRPRVFIATA